MNKELLDIREQLKETRRYTRSNPAASEEIVIEARDRLLCHVIEEYGREHGPLMRAHNNLTVGIKYLPTCPRALEGYIDGAVLELGLGEGRSERCV